MEDHLNHLIEAAFTCAKPWVIEQAIEFWLAQSHKTQFQNYSDFVYPTY